MGMFDTLRFNCRNCGEELDEQSKSGECMLNNYTIENCPASILADLNGTIVTCNKCQTDNTIKSYVFAKGWIE